MEIYPFLSRDSDSTSGKISLMRVVPEASAHQHAYCELIYVLQGTAIRKMQNAEIPVRAGDFYLTTPFTVHGYADVVDMEMISCIFMPELFDRAFCESPHISAALSNQSAGADTQATLSMPNRIFNDFDGTVRQFFLKMEKEQANCHSGYQESLRSYLTLILVYAYRSFEPRSPNLVITQIMEFLKVHYAEPISLNTLGELVGYTPQYVSKLFSQEVGMPFQFFLQQYRMEQACVLLSCTEMSTAEVAAAVGYQDARHFSKLFRRYQNISPHEYRKAFMQ